MTNSLPLTSSDRDKHRGQRIKKIRKELKLTQVDFGILVSKNKSMDRKTVYDWEIGKFCPNDESLKKIAKIGNISIEELLFGSFDSYILGLILNSDTLIQNEFSSTDLSLYDYLKFSNRPVTASLFKNLDIEKKKDISYKTLEICRKKKLTHYDTKQISDIFTDVVTNYTEGDISYLTFSILENLNLIETEWLPDQVKDNSSESNKFSDDGLIAISNAITHFRHELNIINNQYSKLK